MAETSAERLIAQCPACATRFRVTEDMLAVAEGRVRCGACLTVFDGRGDLARKQPARHPGQWPQGQEGQSSTAPAQRAEDQVHEPAFNETDPEDVAAPGQVAQAPGDAEPHGLVADTGEATLEDVPIRDPRQRPAARAAMAELAASPRRRTAETPRKPQLVAAAGTIAMALLLIANVLGLQFHAWSLQPALRGIYETAYAVVGHELPAFKSLAHIEVEDHGAQGRSGPPEALVLEADLVNEAPFRQPFPIFSVFFHGAEGQTVARRIVAPDDYLGSGQPRLMTPTRQVRVALRVDDPGPEAISYTMSLL